MRGVGRSSALCGGPTVAIAIALAGCHDGRLLLDEHLEPAADLKVVTWSDGVVTTAVLRAANEPVEVPVTETLAFGGIVHLAVVGFARAELDAAVPALAGLSADVVLSQINARAGGATPIPGTAPVLVADIDEDTGADLTYQPLPRAEWDRRATEGGRAAVGLAIPDALACALIEPLTVVELPEGFAPAAVAALDRQRAIVTGHTATRDFALLVVTSTSVRLVPPSVPPLSRPSGDASWDPTSDTVWILENTGVLSRVDLDGRRVPFAPTPRPWNFTASAGIDGTVLALSAFTDNGGIATHIYDPRADAWTTVEDFMSNPRLGPARAYRRDRYMADLNCHTSAWELDVQRNRWTWGAAQQNGERASDSNCLLRQRALALDDSQYLWLGARGNLRRGVDDRKGLWPELEHGIAISADNNWPRALAAMTAQRFAVAGDGGQLEVWIGDRWCAPAPATPDVALTLGAGAADVAWFVGVSPDGRARALRVTLREGR